MEIKMEQISSVGDRVQVMKESLVCTEVDVGKIMDIAKIDHESEAALLENDRWHHLCCLKRV
jgi:hypothetical protein